MGHDIYWCKNIVRHTAHTIVSWPNSKQWLVIHTSDLMMIIWLSTHSHNHDRKLGKQKTHSTIYWMKDNCENSLNLGHTLGSIYMASILLVQCLQMILHNDENEIVHSANKWTRPAGHKCIRSFANTIYWTSIDGTQIIETRSQCSRNIYM